MLADVSCESIAIEQGRPRDVRFSLNSGGFANIAAPLFDNLVGAAEQQEWNCEAKCLGRLKVDD
jgi:hypothetical protein